MTDKVQGPVFLPMIQDELWDDWDRPVQLIDSEGWTQDAVDFAAMLNQHQLPTTDLPALEKAAAIVPPYDGIQCPACPLEIRNLFAVASNYCRRQRGTSTSSDTTLEDLESAAKSVKPLIDSHFSDSLHAHGQVSGINTDKSPELASIEKGFALLCARSMFWSFVVQAKEIGWYTVHEHDEFDQDWPAVLQILEANGMLERHPENAEWVRIKEAG